MLNKTKAIRTSKFIDMSLLSTAMTIMNRTAASAEKYMIMCDELDEEPMILDGLIHLSVKVFYNTIVIYERTQTFRKNEKPERVQKIVSNLCATIVVEFIQSGIVNYRLSNDAAIEQGIQALPGMDRISMIKKISAFPPNHSAGISRNWSFSSNLGGNETGDWDFRQLIDAPYEDLIRCYKELNGK